MDELWSKAQTRTEIINRSGTLFNSGVDMDLAMRDAETMLQSGGGLLGKGGFSIEPLSFKYPRKRYGVLTLNSD